MNSHQSSKPGRAAGFTLTEMLVAVGISTVVLAISGTFIMMAARLTSGIVRQTTINDQSGRTSEFIFNRIRFATSLAVDTNGTTLTLGFDDDFTTDSSSPPDKKAYNDQDHYEMFQFVNGDGNDATTADNRLIYKARTNEASTNVLISSAVRKLPNKKFFVLTNDLTTILVNYGLVDDYASDGYQASDVETAFVARNRPDSSLLITILP